IIIIIIIIIIISIPKHKKIYKIYYINIYILLICFVYFTANSDITVVCGPHRIDLRILLCPIYFGGYNETLMALNSVFNKPECMGTPVWSVDPPILQFQFPITETAISAYYSIVQYVNILGMVNSLDPGAGIITYHSKMIYLFSCRYPLQYLVNNTETSVLAINDNNGSFIQTLNMRLYEDNKYTTYLQMPPSGIQLKTRIYVQVRATNLTTRFNVMLDRCYASISPYPINTTYYDLFVGCTRDSQTVMGINGVSQEARFSFEAFRFVEHRNQTISTFYLHCATRLCESSACSSLRPVSQRKRGVNSEQNTIVSDMATVSSGPIITSVDNGETFNSTFANLFNVLLH
uniref:Si:ch73-261i21.5 n=1 Tax=Astyanax mexicanus TaxID=7994 RepID=A0A8B9JGA0_ASTMX